MQLSTGAQFDGGEGLGGWGWGQSGTVWGWEWWWHVRFDWKGPVPLPVDSGVYSAEENTFLTQYGSPFSPQVNVCKEFKWTESNRPNVRSACTRWESPPVSVFHMPSPPFSVIKVVESFQLNPQQLVALPSEVSVLLLWSQSVFISCSSKVTVSFHFFS